MVEIRQTAEDIVAFLEEGDFIYFVRALGHVAKARGMRQVAREAGLGLKVEHAT